MNEATTTVKSKPAKPVAPVSSIFELPKFDLPKFDLPKLEVPAAFREIAEKGVAQAKDAYERVKAAAYNLKVIEAARANTNAAFDYARELLDVKSFSEIIELSTAHARKQFEAVSEQTKELAALAQKVATETTEPLKSGVTKAFRKVA